MTVARVQQASTRAVSATSPGARVQQASVRVVSVIGLFARVQQISLRMVSSNDYHGPSVYPTELPGPIEAPLQPAERRLLSSLPGPRQSRPLQRDRLATQRVAFIFTHAELAIFTAWLDSYLTRAGAWFAADWPQPQGGTGVRRFVGEPSYPTYYPRLGWYVSALCELRGIGEMPQITVSVS